MEKDISKVNSECKNCGGELKFDPAKRTLSCEYCSASYHLPKAKIDAILVRGYSNAFHPNQLNRGLNAYKCDMCGHVYFTASQERSSDCLACGSSSCSQVQSSGYCADGIIPFQISKEEAAEKFESYLKSKPGVPKAFMMEAKNQNLKGVFVPVWNFIFDVDATYTANAVELKKDENGTYYSVPNPVFGTKSEAVKSADQCATSAENDDFLELFDEKDYDKIIPYAPEYTFGYKVDDINRNIHEFYENVTESEREKVRKEISNHILRKYKDVSNMNIATDARDVYFNFTYVPVYVNTFTHKGKVYKTYISGTTGKTVGRTPPTLKGLVKGIAKILGLAAAVALIYYFFIR